MNVGQFLKERREEKGMTLEQAADITKISIRHIAAIEENKFDLLPSKAYAKGFLKLYARCLDISADEVILRYETMTLPPAVATKQEAVLSVLPKRTERVKFKPSPWAVFIIVAVLVIILAIIFSS